MMHRHPLIGDVEHRRMAEWKAAQGPSRPRVSATQSIANGILLTALLVAVVVGLYVVTP